MEEEVVYTPREVARILRVHERTVLRMISRDEIDYFMVGAQYRIRKSALDSFMKKDKRGSEEREPAEV